MATPRFNTVGSANNATPVVAVLEKRLHQEILNDTFFSAFKGIQRPGDQDKAPNGIVVTLNELNAGSDEIISTMRMNYTGEAVIGDAQLLGTEEDFAFRYVHTKVSEKGKAFTIPKKGISAQRVKWMNLAREVKPAASDWWKLEEDFETFTAFYEGCSRHCRNDADCDAQSGDVWSHPNFFAAGTGLVTGATPHTSAWETAVGSAITGVTDTAEDYMGIALLDAMSAFLRTTQKIKPLNLNGRAYYVCLLHPYQIAQLQMESTWQTLVQNADVRGRNNASFQTNRIFPDGIYKQLLIYEHEHVMGAAVSGGKPVYGTTTLHTALDTEVKKCAIIFGAGAMIEAIPEKLHFETETRDYKRKWGLGTLTIRGMKRMDWTPDDGVQTGILNQSSIVFCTYSGAPTFANPAAS